MSVNTQPDGAQGAPSEGEPSSGPVTPPVTTAPAAPADPAAAPVGVRHAPERPAAMLRSRLGGLWVVAVLGAVVLVMLLVFILQNGQRIEVHLYGGHWNAPLGVALLMAAALGVLLVVVPGGGRIIQLKRAARRLHHERVSLTAQLDQATAAPEAPGPPPKP